jgi:hypothetical protein
MPEKYPGISSTRVQIPGYLLALWVGRGEGKKKRERENILELQECQKQACIGRALSLIAWRLAAVCLNKGLESSLG